jgi:hypothetical protein
VVQTRSASRLCLASYRHLPGIAGDGSLRLEELRESSEAYALLSLAASMGKATLADEVAASVVRSMQDYAQLPFEYQTACRRLAEIIAPTKTTKPPRTR